jgi:hypothetical protein
MSVTTYVWERYDATDDHPEDSGWVPRTSYGWPLGRAMEKMEAIEQEQFIMAGGDASAIPTRLLFVEVGGHQQKAVEVRPRPATVKLERI